MTYRIGTPFFVPRRKSELIALIMPHWNGYKKDLQGMGVPQLREILKRFRQKAYVEFMKKQSESSALKDSNTGGDNGT